MSKSKDSWKDVKVTMHGREVTCITPITFKPRGLDENWKYMRTKVQPIDSGSSLLQDIDYAIYSHVTKNTKEPQLIIMNEIDVKELLQNLVDPSGIPAHTQSKSPFFYRGIKVIRTTDLESGKFEIV